MKGTVRAESEKPLDLERLHFPSAELGEKFEPFQAAVVMNHDVREPDAPFQFHRYLEAVLVMAACDDGARIFVKFVRSGTTGWISSDRLTETG